MWRMSSSSILQSRVPGTETCLSYPLKAVDWKIHKQECKDSKERHEKYGTGGEAASKKFVKWKGENFNRLMKVVGGVLCSIDRFKTHIAQIYMEEVITFS
jgi:hypothetical protein